MRWLQGLAFAVVGAILAGAVVRILNPLPSLQARQETRAFGDTTGTSLGRGLTTAVAAHPRLTGVHLLPNARDAFAARVLLARAAQRSIDVQYYIWHNDLTGGLLFGELRAAADRGVRVRLLLDDNNTAGLDAVLADLDGHPNIELRLFNPFTVRSPRLVGYLTDFARLNRRMHNKSFTVDNQVTIVGGRNIGDEYFGAGAGGLFVDLDALAVGTVVPQVSQDFDRYWNSRSAYPAKLILPRATGRSTPAPERRTIESRAARYLDAVGSLPLAEQITKGTVPLEWAPVRLISDDPAKALGRSRKSELMISQLAQLLGRPARTLDLVSGYFVPTEATVETLQQLTESKVRVRVVTNAFEATDVPIVHAGYVGDRKPLLRAGIELWEIRGAVAGAPLKRRSTGVGSAGSVPGGSGSALHAKTFVADGKRAFIGSFNLDPRSARLNTELGFVIESPPLATRMEQRLGEAIPLAAYQLQLAPDDEIVWIERRGDTLVRHDSEPDTTPFGRLVVDLLSKLPIEWLL